MKKLLGCILSPLTFLRVCFWVTVSVFVFMLAMCFVEDGPGDFDERAAQYEQKKLNTTAEQVQQLKAADSLRAGILVLRDGVNRDDYRSFTTLPFELPEGKRQTGHYMHPSALATYQNEIYPALIRLLERFGTKEGETTREFPLHTITESPQGRSAIFSDPFGSYVNTAEYLSEFKNVDPNKAYICVSNCLNTPAHFPADNPPGALRLKISIYSVPNELLQEMNFFHEAVSSRIYWYEMEGDEYLRATQLETWNGHYVARCNGVLHIHGWASLVHGHCAYWDIKSPVDTWDSQKKAEDADHAEVSFTAPHRMAAVFYMESLKNDNPMSYGLLWLVILLDKVWWLTPVIALFLWCDIHDYKMRDKGKKSSVLPDENDLSEPGRKAHLFLSTLPTEITLISRELLPAINSTAAYNDAATLEKELRESATSEADMEVLAHLQEAINFASLRRPAARFGVYVLVTLFLAFIAWLASNMMQFYLCAAYAVVPIIFFMLTLRPNYKHWEEKYYTPVAKPEDAVSKSALSIGIASVLAAFALASKREYIYTVAVDGCGNERVVDKRENPVTTGASVAIGIMVLLFAALCILLSFFCGVYLWRNYITP